MVPPSRIDPMTHRTMSKRSYHRATSRSSLNCLLLYFVLNVNKMLFTFTGNSNAVKLCLILLHFFNSLIRRRKKTDIRDAVGVTIINTRSYHEILDESFK